MNAAQPDDGSEGTAPAGRPRALTVNDYAAGVLAGDRSMLSRAITLIESSSARHETQAQEVLQRVLPHAGKSRRIGITGVPGVGKSTFIEAFGCYLVERSHKVAVLAIDPSSRRSGGSILGDKTRMERLSREPAAFIRPSPSGDSPGGVARRTRESMFLCEAAGFDVVIVETMGVGQAEVALRSMVDFYLLLLLPGAGDELQSIKKGVMEMADAVIVNKADGDNKLRAELACAAQTAALQYLPPATEDWKTVAATCSAHAGTGVPEIWECIERFYRELEPKNVIASRRREQTLDWLSDLIRDGLHRRFYDDPAIKERLPRIQKAVLDGEMTAVRAASMLLGGFGGGASQN